jgi:hypothetical protein
MIFRPCERALRLPRRRFALSDWKMSQLENVSETAECPCLAQAAHQANV